VAKTKQELLQTARESATAAYAPYSNFRVGAAVRVGDKTYTGCNVENASYGLTICAERSAIFAAVAAGAKQIDEIAIACIDAPPGSEAATLMPCGACRQVIAEFGNKDLPVHVDRAGSFVLEQLLPFPFELSVAKSKVFRAQTKVRV
jgi:cytidine deaminase